MQLTLSYVRIFALDWERTAPFYEHFPGSLGPQLVRTSVSRMDHSVISCPSSP